MKGITLSALLCIGVFLAIQPTAAQIGRNFEKAGVGLGGGVSIYNDMGYVLNGSDTYNYWEIEVFPRANFYIADNWDIEIRLILNYQYEKIDSDNIYKSGNYGINLSLSRAFVRHPEATRGFVPTLGCSIGFLSEPGIDDKESGLIDVDATLTLSLNLGPQFYLYYFLNQRLSPFIGIYPRFIYTILYKDDMGNRINLSFDQRTSFRYSASIGITYWLPNREISLVRLKK